MAKENQEITLECGHTKGTFSWYGNRISTNKLFNLLPDDAAEDCKFIFTVNSEGRLGFNIRSTTWEYLPRTLVDFSGEMKVSSKSEALKLHFVNGEMQHIDEESIRLFNNVKFFKEKLAILVKEYDVRLGIELYRESDFSSYDKEDCITIHSVTKNVVALIPEGSSYVGIKNAQINTYPLT